MAAKFPMRNLALYGALAATLAAVIWMQAHDESADDGVQLAAPRHAPRMGGAAEAAQPATHAAAAAGAEQAEAEADKPVDLFRPHAWYVPPPPPKPVLADAPPPVPTAPPVPFIYMGKMENTPRGTLIFLSAGNKTYTVAKGEIIDRVWRVDDEDANTVRLTYMPLSMPQALSKAARPAAPATHNPTENEPG